MKGVPKVVIFMGDPLSDYNYTLTKNKSYDIIYKIIPFNKLGPDVYYIKNDNGQCSQYEVCYFKSLEDYRNETIDKILWK